MPKLFGGGDFKTNNLKKLYLQTDTTYNLTLEGGVIVGMFYQNGGTMAKAERENVKQNCEGKSRDVFAKFMSDNYEWDIHKAKAFTYTKEIFDADKNNNYQRAKQWFRGNGNAPSREFKKNPFFDKAYKNPDDDLGFSLSASSSDATDSDDVVKITKLKNPKIEKKDVGDIYNMPKKKATAKKATPKKATPKKDPSKTFIKDKPGFGIAIFTPDSKTPKVVKILKRNPDGSVYVNFSKTKKKDDEYTYEEDAVLIPKGQLIEDSGGEVQLTATLTKYLNDAMKPPDPPKMATPPTSANPSSPSPLKGRKKSSASGAGLGAGRATTQTANQTEREKNAIKMTYAKYENLYPDATREEYAQQRGVAVWVEKRWEKKGKITTYYKYKQDSKNPIAPSGLRAIKTQDPTKGRSKWIDPDTSKSFTPDAKVYTDPEPAPGAGEGPRAPPIVATWDGIEYENPRNGSSRPVTRGVGTAPGGVRGQQQTQSVPAPAPTPVPISGQINAPIPPSPPPSPTNANRSANILQGLARRRTAQNNAVSQMNDLRNINERMRNVEARDAFESERRGNTRTRQPEDRTYAEPTDREQNIRFNISEQENREKALGSEREAQEQEAGEKDLTDDKPEISTSGHQRAVSLVAVKYGRDFTYYKNLVETGVLQSPPTSYAQRKTAMMQCLAEYGAIFEIDKFNTDYTMDEAVEIYALKAIYKEVIDEERAWKKALIKMGQRMGVDPNYQTGPPGALEPGMVIPLNALGAGQDRIMDFLEAAGAGGGQPPPPPPGAGLGGESKGDDPDAEDIFSDDSFGDNDEEEEEEEAPAPAQAPAKRNNKPLINKQNKLTKRERAELNKFRYDKKTQPRGTSTRQRKKKELDPEGLKFNTHTRMNPNLLMQLGRVGFPTHNNQMGEAPTFSRIQTRSKPIQKLSFKIF